MEQSLPPPLERSPRVYREWSLEVLVEQLLSHPDEELWAELVRRLEPETYAWALSYAAGDRDLAADLWQEAWVKIYRSLHKFTREGSFSGWLVTVVGNASKSELRKQKRHAHVALDLTERHSAAKTAGTRLTDGLLELLAPEDSPSAEYEKNERVQIVLAALDGLSWKERNLLLMKREGYSSDEIALALGYRGADSVNSMHNKVKRKFRAELARRGLLDALSE